MMMISLSSTKAQLRPVGSGIRPCKRTSRRSPISTIWLSTSYSLSHSSSPPFSTCREQSIWSPSWLSMSSQLDTSLMQRTSGSTRHVKISSVSLVSSRSASAKSPPPSSCVSRNATRRSTTAFTTWIIGEMKILPSISRSAHRARRPLLRRSSRLSMSRHMAYLEATMTLFWLQESAACQDKWDSSRLVIFRADSFQTYSLTSRRRPTIKAANSCVLTPKSEYEQVL